MVFYPDMSCYPTHFWEVKHANLGGVFDGNIGTDPQCLCHVLHPGGHRFRQSLPGTETYFSQRPRVDLNKSKALDRLLG